jgi:hypothetical protein
VLDTGFRRYDALGAAGAAILLLLWVGSCANDGL